MRFPNTDFQHLNLRVHEVLHDARLLDVWAIPLANGGEGRTIQDILKLIERADPRSVHPAVRALFWLREQIGRVLRWDAPPPRYPPVNSYVHRLPDAIIAASLRKVGVPYGPVRLLYQLENELLAEVINATGHAFISLSLFAQDDGYIAYLAIYVLYTRWWTRYYLWLIAPFRHWIIYPLLVRALQQHWQATFQTPSIRH